MNQYNISKYNPKFRDGNWVYSKNEWTSVSDIGKVFEGKLLTIDDYLKVENSYISAIKLIMKFCNINYFLIKDLRESSNQKNFELSQKNLRVKYTKKMSEIYNDAYNIKKIEWDDVEDFCKILLREDVCAKIYYPRKFKLFIAEDYLMGINTRKNLNKIKLEIESFNLYLEEKIL